MQHSSMHAAGCLAQSNIANGCRNFVTPLPLLQPPYHQLQLPMQQCHPDYTAMCQGAQSADFAALADDPLMSSIVPLSEAWAWNQHLAAD